jgi:hypothetical protein
MQKHAGGAHCYSTEQYRHLVHKTMAHTGLADKALHTRPGTQAATPCHAYWPWVTLGTHVQAHPVQHAVMMCIVVGQLACTKAYTAVNQAKAVLQATLWLLLHCPFWR